MRWRDASELAVLVLGFGAYFLVRGAVIDRPAEAYEHARQIIDAERWLGVYWEPRLNSWAADERVLAQTMNLVYFWLHFPLITVFGVWLFVARRHQYHFLRNAFLASGAIGLLGYALYPVAPPRELPALAQQFEPGAPADVLGYVDTMREYLGYAYQTQSTRPFVNPYAAMPSLHFGWDLLLGLGIARAFPRHRPVLALAVLLPGLQVPAVVLTANHFFLDIAGGAVAAGLGLAIAVGLQRWARSALGARSRAARRVARLLVGPEVVSHPPPGRPEGRRRAGHRPSTARGRRGPGSADRE